MFYAQVDGAGICFAVSNLADTIDSPNLISIDSLDSDKLWRKYVNGVWSVEKYTVPANNPLDLAKALKIDELKTAQATAIATFTSSALGSPHTYLAGDRDMAYLNGEYTYIKSDDYKGESPLWYTIEAGNVAHTKAQFVQVYLDGRNNVQTNSYRRAIKEGQVGACTTADLVGTIAWTNPNPPNVPLGLAGTAGATGSGQVTLNWAANSDVTMLGGGGYNVYADGVKSNSVLVTAATYTATGLAVGAHTFQITAVDTDGLESAKCVVVSVEVA